MGKDALFIAVVPWRFVRDETPFHSSRYSPSCGAPTRAIDTQRHVRDRSSEFGSQGEKADDECHIRKSDAHEACQSGAGRQTRRTRRGRRCVGHLGVFSARLDRFLTMILLFSAQLQYALPFTTLPLTRAVCAAKALRDGITATGGIVSAWH